MPDHAEDDVLQDLRRTVGDFLAKHSPQEEVRRLMEADDGHDPRVWAALGELGLHGLTVPERHGGGGATPVEQGAVFEEMGAALYGGPYFATVALASTALQELAAAPDGDAAARELPAVAIGAVSATLAWSGPDPASSALRARRHGEKWVLSGVAEIVVGGAQADLVLVAAGIDVGTALLAVAGDAAGFTRTPLTAMDQTRRLARLEFSDTPARLLGTAETALRRAHDLALLYLAAEQLGGAAHMLDLCVDHAGTRVQFGRAIGSFQAVKHRCADMLVDVESARSVVHAGLRTAATDPAGLAAAAALARSVASDVYRRVATDAIQIHGGIGFTWEHPAHLYLKRAKSSQLLLGSPATHRTRLAGLVGVTSGPAPAAAEPDVPAAGQRPGPDAVLDRAVTDFLREHPVPDPADREADRAFRATRFDAGLAFVHFAPGSGGRGLDPALQPTVEDRFRRAGAADHMSRNVIGLGMALPTIHAHGTPAQRQRYLRPGYTGEEIWCQLFSEPGAGSDLAALATRAVRDGDTFIIDGQKIWTSLGHVARHGILLARTDPGVPKHRGLTYFLLDMRSPGVEVRPLRQLTGEDEFNEVYLTGVRVPAANVLGEVGDGWRVAMTTLANERVSLGGHRTRRGEGPIAQAVELYRAAAAESRTDAATLERLMQLWTRAEAARLTNVRATARPGHRAGPEGSIAKLQMAELNKAIFELCVDLSGPAGLLVDGYERIAPDTTAVHGGSDVRKSYLRALANSIEGGTSEIQRTILGERVLGLPAEQRGDRDVAWRDLPRS
jgi:alkylation response protein AidB-like acyl-CoA dehydrogenase